MMTNNKENSAPLKQSSPFFYGVRVIFSRELNAYFDSSIAYIYASVFLLLSSMIFMNSFFLESVVDMSEYFRILPLLLVLFIPAITMRKWAEERAQGTFEILMTLPLRSVEVILGKYLASCSFYLLVLSGSLPIVFMLTWLGSPDLGLIFSSYIGALFLGAFFLSFGIFISGLTADQIVAFVLTIFMGAIFVLSGNDKVVEVLDGLTPNAQLGSWLYESISVIPHYEAFSRGVIRLADILYFLLMIVFFVAMNEITLKRSKY